jgi:uncharacterized protein YkwD
MRTPRSHRQLRSTAWVAVALGLLLLAPASAAAAKRHHQRVHAAQAVCPGSRVATANALRLELELLCLHNAVREAHGLSKMDWNPRLAGAADRHARDMVARRYFAHDTPEGRDHMDRLAAAGYRPTAGCWGGGENLQGTVGRVTPVQLLAAWMESPAHRAVVLHRGWQDFGLGVATRSYQGDPRGLTLVAEFGKRGRGACS